MVDIYRASVKRTDDFCTIEVLRHSSEEEDQRAPVPRVEAERKVTSLKVLAILCGLLLAALISLSVYHFINLNHKDQDLEELRNLNDILTSNYSDLLEAHATLQSEYARNYSALHSLYTTLKEKNDEVFKEFSNLKEFYCDGTNTTHENTCSVCKPGWVPFRSKCYFLSIDIRNWNDSQDWCKKVDGQLVNIESLEELVCHLCRWI
ncbi:C-type lectin domain family 4 member M-like isoform X3 [Erpetoichthys calabaricus]|uniref:C-type lectin domain family 4 member M-like isoform X3 n=1 Tax=Erpetoichthys calabaricus TaxID=27687 RepID=UPI002234C15E|nr:C-type lectin domain family 4 member M-like isoform X3 [Erpetoichthys calabaricus]